MSKRLRDVAYGSVHSVVPIPVAVERMGTSSLGAYLERAVRDTRHYLKGVMPTCGDCDRVNWSQETSVSPKSLEREVLLKGECKARTCPDEEQAKITGFKIDRVWVDECEKIDDDTWRKLVQDEKLQASMKRTIDETSAKAFQDLWMQHTHSSSWKPVDWPTQAPTAAKPNPDKPLTPSAGDW